MDTDQMKQATYALLRELGVSHGEALTEYLEQAWQRRKVEEAAALQAWANWILPG